MDEGRGNGVAKRRRWPRWVFAVAMAVAATVGMTILMAAAENVAADAGLPRHPGLVPALGVGMFSVVITSYAAYELASRWLQGVIVRSIERRRASGQDRSDSA